MLSEFFELILSPKSYTDPLPKIIWNAKFATLTGLLQCCWSQSIRSPPDLHKSVLLSPYSRWLLPHHHSQSSFCLVPVVRLARVRGVLVLCKMEEKLLGKGRICLCRPGKSSGREIVEFMLRLWGPIPWAAGVSYRVEVFASPHLKTIICWNPSFLPLYKVSFKPPLSGLCFR